MFDRVSALSPCFRSRNGVAVICPLASCDLSTCAAIYTRTTMQPSGRPRPQPAACRACRSTKEARITHPRPPVGACIYSGAAIIPVLATKKVGFGVRCYGLSVADIWYLSIGGLAAGSLRRRANDSQGSPQPYPITCGLHGIDENVSSLCKQHTRTKGKERQCTGGLYLS